MSVAQEMLDTFPGAPQVAEPSLYITAIDRLFDCVQACTACADACVAEDSVADLRRCIRLTADCADICLAGGRILSRQDSSDQRVLVAILEACIAACGACAQECERHEHGHCEICALACRHCEEACTALRESLR